MSTKEIYYIPFKSNGQLFIAESTITGLSDEELTEFLSKPEIRECLVGADSYIPLKENNNEN